MSADLLPTHSPTKWYGPSVLGSLENDIGNSSGIFFILMLAKHIQNLQNHNTYVPTCRDPTGSNRINERLLYLQIHNFAMLCTIQGIPTTHACCGPRCQLWPFKKMWPIGSDSFLMFLHCSKRWMHIYNHLRIQFGGCGAKLHEHSRYSNDFKIYGQYYLVNYHNHLGKYSNPCPAYWWCTSLMIKGSVRLQLV